MSEPNFHETDLYPVVSSEFSGGRDPISILTELCCSDIKIVQMREKSLKYSEQKKLAHEFRKITRKYGKLLIINDSVEIALAVDADGVHLGNDDIPVRKARAMSENLIIGRSTHNMDEALLAESEGADYINVGPIFATSTKSSAEPVGMETFVSIKEQVSLPITVMGGINAENLEYVLKNGASKVAMVKAIIKGNIKENLGILYAIYRSVYPIKGAR